jgi:chromosome segregation ATPase
MSFDEEPDGDAHGECAAEIHRLESQLAEANATIEEQKAVIADQYAAIEKQAEMLRAEERIDRDFEAAESQLATALDTIARKDAEIEQVKAAVIVVQDTAINRGMAIESLRAKLEAAEKDAVAVQESMRDLVQIRDAEVRRLNNEIYVLRLYGNKDCTAMADTALQSSPTDAARSKP